MKNLRQVSKSRVNKIHFIGIGGSGMSGIAEVLHNLDYQISGSDIYQNSTTDRLSKMGCKISYQHHAQNIVDAQAVVVSSAISLDNPELIAAQERHIPIVPRAEMLAEIMRFRFGIAVAGTHGKTTTTSIIAHILNQAELDPTYIIGGILNSNGVNAKLGESDYLIAEADESDASFLHLQPMLSIITNVDQDHMATYDNDYQQLKDTFVSFTSNLPFYGACILCSDDQGVRDIMDNIHRPVISYGLNTDADIRAINIKQVGMQMHFDVVCTHANSKYNQTFPIQLNLIGKHNILNTLAAIGVCCELDINISIVQSALNQFSGVARRLDYHGQLAIQEHSVDLFDDYGHHPVEINAIFDSLKNTYPDRRLVVIFQPHRYSRTRDLFDDFARVLSYAQGLILLDIYPASEKPITHISSSTLAESIRKRSTLNPVVIKDAQEALNVLPHLVNQDDVLLTLGAGDIHTLPSLLKANYG
ncbi:UDP-N-acetylmuramate--L-alanine ligase [Candidatus Thioglobus sp.]|jgi:UDP-N-acetylmuramate--alanine ligase|uniref:UDP-N-acetylmuramate--L-alanine ligase n=1 Tax=Candidatus Thioglobus sp. TaxID=2026721 RepID=UPI001D9BD61F|nr:UDP-N-acetylmuramate--L-alanine ligase [Candidatus Thioglobus sp.]MBT3276617.1 UDP-N-acetylmuramate--L-alanine ligase [Candidatus Thioglobus sp.]MBT3447212.1 UDP-N-acetylmuramate--L-alanine ligase [Candidatus Thioglobus sp.]MBT4001476.1 UDP-N-acetylmuramate--L-alanine ligase [Candidatus Thioglobus sp.]MBT5164768.1 UDP-N-acetylmuramate--L-alanine ligase [Candidatus Thioglobus sp.]MBT6279398.1 UDP-N-acetylmuramate--L-alanine ligase [Candidatus Thioglobus sp.]